MFAALARAVTRRPWLVIVSWLVVAAALVLAAPGIGSVSNPDQAAFLPSGSESARAAALAAREFPGSTQDTAVIVVSRPGGNLSEADVAAVGRLADLPRAEGVTGITFDPARDVAANRRVAILVVGFAGPAERADTQSAVAALRRSAAAAVAGTGLSVGMTGQAAVAADTRTSFNRATVIVTVATLALIVALLLLIFRSPVAALLPLLTVGLVYAVTTALIACAGRLLGFQVGQELPTMLTVVLFGIGTDYVLFLLFRYRERLRAGDGPTEAVVTALSRVGEVIASAALAVIAAFAALILARLGFFRTLGPALAIGVGVTLLAALTLVPAVVTVLGRWTFWPSRPRASGAAAPVAEPRFAVLGRAVGRRPAAVLAGGLVLLAALGAGLGSVRPSYDPVGQLPAGTEASRAFRELQVGFPAGALNPTTVYLRTAAPLAATQLDQFTARLAAVPGVASPLPPVVSADGRTAGVPLVLSGAPYSTAALNLVDGPLRDAARAAAPAGSTVLLGGQTMAYAEIRNATHRDLAVIFPVAAALFALILAGLLRALLAPVQLVVLVIAGFAATLGATAWLFTSSLAFSIPIVLYLFVTAIGTDYNILITARLREEIRDGRRPREAAALAVAHAGPSVAAAAAILAGTFAALLISGVPFFVQIGFAVTLGIALVAYVVSILLVPACGALTGSAAWWPARPRPTMAADMNPPRVVAGR
ncbi:MMPL family transporter [Rugosimonospora africana]|uniref:Putative membrane protein n=1 Tax=Rugosimonospora africana TaxID=556532 RepID=A0A8J3QLW3_9ACTN|nr:MMPL family transporter [Rugosimonospora africana]GIH13368.1 putative membrane protein [Rugosimonospora africana]